MKIQIARRRNAVGWLDSNPSVEAQNILALGGFGTARYTGDDILSGAFAGGSAAIVLEQTDTKPIKVSKDLEAYGRTILDHGCQIFVLGTQWVDAVYKTVRRLGLPMLSTGTAPDEPAMPHVRVFTEGVRWDRIFSSSMMFEPEPGPNRALKIFVDGKIATQHSRELREEHWLLVARAFANCTEVHLDTMHGGKSGGTVYKGFAETEGAIGRWQQPHFVKIGSRDKILKEFEKYELAVRPYIPFHLGPHLIHYRCRLGALEGIIVGDYVHESESLVECASQGRAVAAIACLFDRTLVGWHRHARKDDKSVAQLLESRFPPKMPPPRMKQAKAVGATQSLAALRKLVGKCVGKPTLVGQIHGDLHANNIRVRGGEAIVIDFYGYKDDAPLLWDAATLEASLLVDGFGDSAIDIGALKDSVFSLYTEPLFDSLSDPANPRDRSFWFHSAVRQIRRHARDWECSDGQYAAALAVALLAKASRDSNVTEPEASRRALAYLLAEQLLARFSSSLG